MKINDSGYAQRGKARTKNFRKAYAHILSELFVKAGSPRPAKFVSPRIRKPIQGDARAGVDLSASGKVLREEGKSAAKEKGWRPRISA